MRRGLVMAAMLLVVVAGCSPASPSGAGQSSAPANREKPSRTLVVAVRYEPQSLAVVPLRDTGSGVSSTTRLFNAELDLKDGKSQAHPYLADALPRLHTGSWQVFPDGRMETTYRLKDNITWQD